MLRGLVVLGALFGLGALAALAGCSLDWDGLSSGLRDASVDGPVDGAVSDAQIPCTTPGCRGFVGLELGDRFGCGVTRDGEVVCWGLNDDAELGVGTTAPATAPAVADLGSPAAAVEAGGAFACARTTGGDVACWGANDRGQVGDGSTAPRVPSPSAVDVHDVVDLSAGATHACAVTSDGHTRCWGSNAHRQIGAPMGEVSSGVPVLVSGADGAARVAAGGAHTCVVADRDLLCWGANEAGQCGDADPADRADPRVVADLTDVNDVVAGARHTCAIDTGGNVFCFGADDRGQLGGAGSSETPVRIVGGVEELAAGAAHTCVRDRAGGVECWGENLAGELGREGPGPLVEVALPDAALAIGAGGGDEGGHTCVVTTAALLCFGQRGFGQLGDGAITFAPPTAIDVAHGLVAAGARETTAYGPGALAWGADFASQLGTDAPPVNGVSSPAAMALPANPTDVALGDRHGCAIVAGEVFCWGDATRGRLGLVSPTSPVAPTRVAAAGAGFTAIEAGSAHTCALRAGGAYCWGANDHGQLGRAGGDSEVVAVASTNATALALGEAHTCSITATGSVFCWGRVTEGETGTPTMCTAEPCAVALPTLVPGVTSALGIAAGRHHTCARTADAVRCWGANDFGQLGTSDAGPSPRVVPGVTARALAAGAFHTCALTTSGGVTCWGRLDSGRLGRPGEGVGGPGDVVGLAPASYADLVAGDDHTCASDGARTLVCWGRTAHGRLADGELPFRVDPGVAIIFAAD